MTTQGKLTVLLATLPLFCLLAADRSGEKSAGTTNLFSNWTGASSNITVRSQCPPWGCSSVGYIKVPANYRKPIVIDEVVQERQLRKQREKLLGVPPLTETYHVRLGTSSSDSTGSSR
jgi:hypothetical protein